MPPFTIEDLMKLIDEIWGSTPVNHRSALEQIRDELIAHRHIALSNEKNLTEHFGLPRYRETGVVQLVRILIEGNVTIEELVGKELVDEHGHDGALRLFGEERDRLAQLDEDINKASAALLPDTTVNHLHKLTGVEALMIEHFGSGGVDDRGLVESVKELLEEFVRMGELIDEKGLVVGQVLETERPSTEMAMGRIVRFVDNNDETMPMLVSKVHGFEGVISGHVFPWNAASRRVTSIRYEIPVNGKASNDTWHWPGDGV